MSRILEPLEDHVGDLFVDRYEELAFYWKWATRIPSPLPHDSHALIGRRRTGKTAIMTKLFNRLFNEQTRVLPIYISFARYLYRSQPFTLDTFAEEFFAGYLRNYFAFRHRDPLIIRFAWQLDKLRAFAQQVQDQPILDLIQSYDNATNSLQRAFWVINIPSALAYAHEIPSVILIDEFQILTDTINPQDGSTWNLANGFQQAAEAHWAPLLVSGSAVSVLVDDALGGALSGRFGYRYLKSLPKEYAIDLVFRLGQREGIPVTEELAEALFQLTAGDAYALECLLSTASPALQHFPSLDALEEVLTYELRDHNGKMRQHYRREFSKYTHQLNQGKTTWRVMLWATKYPNEHINAKQVAEAIGATEEEVRAALDKLYHADVVDQIGLFNYQGPSDPMLRRYIEYQHATEIEELAPEEILKDWKTEYSRLRGRMNAFTGEVAEVYIEGVMRRFDGRTVDGALYFGQASMVTLPKFSKLERRLGIVKSGIPVEMDVMGEYHDPNAPADTATALPSIWFVQAKYMQDPVHEGEVRYFLEQTEMLLSTQKYSSVTRWYVSKSGFTKPATQMLQTAGILVSDLAQFNQLARLFGFIGLPG